MFWRNSRDCYGVNSDSYLRNGLFAVLGGEKMCWLVSHDYVQ